MYYLFESEVFILKLNPDCVRDLMLYFEEHSSYSNEININQLTLSNYSQEELVYTSEKLNEANLINCVSKNYMGSRIPIIIVKSITYSGHNFLNNIRDNEVYNKTKMILSSFKSVSIEIISETASKVLTSLISKQLGLPN